MEPCCYSRDGYLEGYQVPLDGWKSEFIYIGPDETRDGTYKIISFGPDGMQGTKDDIFSQGAIEDNTAQTNIQQNPQRPLTDKDYGDLYQRIAKACIGRDDCVQRECGKQISIPEDIEWCVISVKKIQSP